MKPKVIVKTETKAVEVLSRWLDQNRTEELLSTDTVIRPTSATCECGETRGMKAFFEGGNKIAIVAVCKKCGDDGHTLPYVIHIVYLT